jgi:hypothetical protein
VIKGALFIVLGLCLIVPAIHLWISRSADTLRVGDRDIGIFLFILGVLPLAIGVAVILKEL